MFYVGPFLKQFYFKLQSVFGVILDVSTYPSNLQMSGSRMKVAGRFKPCAHMGCFDLEVFVELNQRSRKASYI